MRESCWRGIQSGLGALGLAGLVLFALATPLPAADAADAAPRAALQNQRLGRGVNILGYDPIWRSRKEARFQVKHFRQLKEGGFNSVRINLHPFRHMDREAGWALPKSWLATLDWAMTNATASGLMVVLDLHEFGAMSKDPEGNREKYLAAWRQLATHCQKAPDQVLFELLNEPSKKLTPALWNQYLREALAIVRESNPKRTVIVGPPFWNSIGHLDELELPANDRRLIVTVHYYTPMEFTHQGASWASHKDKSNVDWLGTAAELKAVRDDFAKAATWARKHDRPIFLGEFGAYDKAPMASRVRYTNAVARTAESFGWSWAYWQFDSDFILYDIDRDAWVRPIHDALAPPADRAVQSSRYQGKPFQGQAQSIPARLARIRAAKMPPITKPTMFDTPEADAMLSALEVFPPDNLWNQVITDWPPHPNSKKIIASIGLDKPLRYNPDMGFILVPPDQKRIAVKIVDYPDESDKGPFPAPDNLPIEGWPVMYRRGYDGPRLTLEDIQRDKFNHGGDRHGIVVDPVNRMLYEFYATRRTDSGWQAAQASVFDLKTNRLRPAGWTSADAAGLPIFPAIVRYDELKRGTIEHALRVTVRKTRRAYVAPATHFASSHTNADYPRMGERIRLRKDFDIASFSPEVKAILQGLQTYGMFVADNGIEWAISVAPDPRIPSLHEELRRVKGSDFEVAVAPK